MSNWEKIRLWVAPVKWNLKLGALRTHVMNYAFAISQTLNWWKWEVFFRLDNTDNNKNNDEIMNKIITVFNEYLGITCDINDFINQKENHCNYEKYYQYLSARWFIIENSDGTASYNVRRFIEVYDKIISIQDTIRGNIQFNLDEVFICNQKEDFRIRRSDGSYLYNFISPIDDAQMWITNVVRWNDKIHTIPFQEIIKISLGLQDKKYTHLPLLFNNDGESQNIMDLLKIGIVKDVLIFYIVESIYNLNCDVFAFNMQDFYKNFDIKNIRKSDQNFDINKLKDINKKFLLSLEWNWYIQYLCEFLEEIQESQMLNVLRKNENIQHFVLDMKLWDFLYVYDILKRLLSIQNHNNSTLSDEEKILLKELAEDYKKYWTLSQDKKFYKVIRYIFIGKSIGPDIALFFELYKYDIFVQQKVANFLQNNI